MSTLVTGVSEKRGEVLPVTVGILTYNSGATLARALESVRGCGEILIADGGSIDETLDIAWRYGARVIGQSSDGPIVDFSLERNRVIEAAQYSWYLSLDSDEVASPELIAAIRDITAREAHGEAVPQFYSIYQLYTSPDMQQRYRSFKKQHQIRFFDRRAAGARFRNVIHEHVYPSERTQVEMLDAWWATPLDIDGDFATFKEKVRRNAQVIEDYDNKNPFVFVRQGIVPGLVTTGKWLLKNAYMRIWYPARECVPFRFELYRLYEVWYMIGAYVRRYVRLLFRK